MKTVGEWVSRPVPGRSIPRGDSAPPNTLTVGSTAFTAAYVRLSSERYAGAAASVPSALNCGSQKRFRFGSLPTITFCRSGTLRTRSAARPAKLAWSASESGVVLLPKL